MHSQHVVSEGTLICARSGSNMTEGEGRSGEASEEVAATVALLGAQQRRPRIPFLFSRLELSEIRTNSSQTPIAHPTDQPPQSSRVTPARTRKHTFSWFLHRISALSFPRRPHPRRRRPSRAPFYFRFLAGLHHHRRATRCERPILLLH